jgi:hypothetical protein
MRSILCRYILAGVLAGAAGTAALYVVTYLDQVVRGRPSSNLPQQTAGRLAEMVGLNLGEGQKAESRKQGIGALLGIGTGVFLGAAYGGLRVRVRDVSVPVGGVGLWVAASVAGNAPMTALGLTDPRTWGMAGWLSDLVPHLVYGLVTAYAFHMMADQAGARRSSTG